MKKYLIVNDYDGNDSFEIEAETYIDAMEKALQELGYWVAVGEEKDE